MFKRILAAIFGGILFAIIAPIIYWFLTKSMPLDGFLHSLILLASIGFAIGATLGALFPKVFGFIFEIFVDI